MTEQEPIRPAGDSTPTDPAWRPPQPEVEVNHTYAPPAGAGAATAPVTRTGRGTATRWGIALVVVAIVVGVAAAAVFLASGASTPSTLLGYAPKDAVSWTEVRMDLPGDQRTNLGSFLSKFPGFADQSTLEAKLNEALDRIVKAATRDTQDYSTKIKPWFGGEIGIAIPKLPDPATIGGSSTPEMSALAMVSVTDAAKARAWFDDAVKDSPHSSSTYNGVDLVTVGENKSGVMGIVDGKVMLLGDDASVKAAIDSKGQSGLSTNDRFKAASDAMTGDALVTYYVDGKAYVEWAGRAAQQTGSAGASTGSFLETYADRVPAWIAGRVRVEGDALRVEQVSPHVDAGPKHENRLSNLISRLPASTIVALDMHDLGATLLDTVDLARKVPGSEDAFKQIDQAVALVGGWDALLKWMGDTGIVVTRDGTKVGGGLVSAPTDKAQAQQLVTTLKGFLALGGSSMGVTMRDETYNGTTITVLSVGGATALPTGGTPEIGIAATDNVVVIGADLDFVKSVIDVKAGSSLADNARYKAMLDRVGSKNASSVWFDATALRELFEGLGTEQSPSEMAQYEKDVKPYIQPFDAIAGASVLDGSVDRMTLVLTVKAAQ